MAGDLAKIMGDPVAILSSSIPIHSKEQQVLRYGGVFTPNTLDLLRRYDETEIPAQREGVTSNEWESFIFCQPPLTLYTRKPGCEFSNTDQGGDNDEGNLEDDESDDKGTEEGQEESNNDGNESQVITGSVKDRKTSGINTHLMVFQFTFLRE
ncbi:hypothetical protein K491DRAFT_685612 [Lophiostoma macrostomum CBS 122681]|uniref:Uncharacterized protein n=1 Tax=Lophiostoma macrostomum CBS 122681 TaxID=1314788 RepID=A0A6A6SK31_9PLEO|nr:hypothetical protein K491DRAFT_685612 [Lophiostoma macrostomum CBS 122681]